MSVFVCGFYVTCLSHCHRRYGASDYRTYRRIANRFYVNVSRIFNISAHHCYQCAQRLIVHLDFKRERWWSTITEVFVLNYSTTTQQSTQNSSLSPQHDHAWLDGLNSPLIQDEGDSKMLKLRFDVSQYTPEEIVVKTVDNKLLVSEILVKSQRERCLNHMFIFGILWLSRYKKDSQKFFYFFFHIQI